MARPIKQGVDYFPFDVHLDDKFKFVEIKYKLEGFAVVVKLMQRIYSHGYWCKWSEDEALLFSDEIKADFNLVQSVIEECVNRGVFNKDLYNSYGILTSKGIQKRYKEIVRRRKGVEVTEEYLLIDNNFGVNDDINGVDDDIKTEVRQQSDGKSTQTKLNKTKLNKNTYTDEFEEFWSEYPRKLDKKGAFEKFNQAIKRGNSEQQIINGARMYKRECEVKGTEKQYIKHAKTFLHNDSFLNEFETKVNVGTHKKQNGFEPRIQQPKKLTEEDFLF